MKISIHELLNKSEIVFKGEEVITLLNHNSSGKAIVANSFASLTSLPANN